MKNKRMLALILLSLLPALCACGIKPAYVEPPEGAEHTDFPSTYPDISTDPMPGLENKNL